MLALYTLYGSAYCQRFKNLLAVMFGAWIVLFLVTNTFMKSLNKIVVPVIDMPLGFYMPMQAAVIVFAVSLFLFARTTR